MTSNVKAFLQYIARWLAFLETYAASDVIRTLKQDFQTSSSL